MDPNLRISLTKTDEVSGHWQAGNGVRLAAQLAVRDGQSVGVAVVGYEWSIDGITFVRPPLQPLIDNGHRGTMGIDIAPGIVVRFVTLTGDAAADEQCGIYIREIPFKAAAS